MKNEVCVHDGKTRRDDRMMMNLGKFFVYSIFFWFGSFIWALYCVVNEVNLIYSLGYIVFLTILFFVCVKLAGEEE